MIHFIPPYIVTLLSFLYGFLQYFITTFYSYLSLIFTLREHVLRLGLKFPPLKHTARSRKCLPRHLPMKMLLSKTSLSAYKYWILVPLVLKK
jgi:hypothetical protein